MQPNQQSSSQDNKSKSGSAFDKLRLLDAHGEQFKMNFDGSSHTKLSHMGAFLTII